MSSEHVKANPPALVHLQCWGREGPRVLLIHGDTPAAGNTWLPQRPLAKDHQLAIPDRLGFGASPSTDALDAHADALAVIAALEDLVGDSLAPIHLVGHSHGAVVALLIATAREDLVRSLVIVEPPLLRLTFGPEVSTSELDRSAEEWLGSVAHREHRRFPRKAWLAGRRPWDALVDFDALKRSNVRPLVVSGGWSLRSEQICDEVSARVAGQRHSFHSAGHDPHRLGGPFNDLLREWWNDDNSTGIRWPSGGVKKSIEKPPTDSVDQRSNVDEVLLVAPRGFCAGVEMAIAALDELLSLFGPPVYCYHHIVHNKLVVQSFERAGVRFVDDLDDVPEGAPLLLSAHGSAPEVEKAANARTSAVVNAVCPLVRKVHHEIRARAAAGYQILYVGHAEHDETVGAMAIAPTSTVLVQRPDDVAGLPNDGKPIALLAQTTLGQWEWAAVLDSARERFGPVWIPSRKDLCFATTNRQDALLAVLDECDAVVVVGSASSSNTTALVELAKRSGSLRVQRVDTAAELDPDLRGIVAVTAGASVPESAVSEVVARLAPRNGVRLRETMKEDEFFPLPPELRELARRRGPHPTPEVGASMDQPVPVRDAQSDEHRW